MALRQRIRTVLTYPPRRWADLVVAAGLTIRVERALTAGGVSRAARIARVQVAMDGHAAPVVPLHGVDLSLREREQLDAAWRLLRRPPFNGTCLRRALVGGYFLRRRHPLLRIGVAKTDGVVEAHAWIEVDGHGLDPDGSAKYAVLDIPRGGS